MTEFGYPVNPDRNKELNAKYDGFKADMDQQAAAVEQELVSFTRDHPGLAERLMGLVKGVTGVATKNTDRQWLKGMHDVDGMTDKIMGESWAAKDAVDATERAPLVPSKIAIAFHPQGTVEIPDALETLFRTDQDPYGELKTRRDEARAVTRVREGEATRALHSFYNLFPENSDARETAQEAIDAVRAHTRSETDKVWGEAVAEHPDTSNKTTNSIWRGVEFSREQRQRPQEE